MAYTAPEDAYYARLAAAAGQARLTRLHHDALHGTTMDVAYELLTTTLRQTLLEHVFDDHPKRRELAAQLTGFSSALLLAPTLDTVITILARTHDEDAALHTIHLENTLAQSGEYVTALGIIKTTVQHAPLATPRVIASIDRLAGTPRECHDWLGTLKKTAIVYPPNVPHVADVMTNYIPHACAQTIRDFVHALPFHTDTIRAYLQPDVKEALLDCASQPAEDATSITNIAIGTIFNLARSCTPVERAIQPFARLLLRTPHAERDGILQLLYKITGPLCELAPGEHNTKKVRHNLAMLQKGNGKTSQ